MKYSSNNAHSAYESVLLGEGGKDEVGMRHRQKLSLGLAALGRALAENAARTHRHQRLNHLVARAAGSRPRAP